MTFNCNGAGFPLWRESIAKVTGKARFTQDLTLEGMVYGKILRSPHAHAKVTSLDISEAQGLPGVLGIITFKDVPGTLYTSSGLPPTDLLVEDERILTGEPKYVGDRIAAVAAVDETTCDLALSKIKVTYSRLPEVFDIEKALEKDAPLVQPAIADSNIAKTYIASEGNVEKGLEEASYVFEGEYYTPIVQHIALEPTGCICSYTADDQLTVWSTSQTPHHDRRILSNLMGLSQNRIRIIKPMMGGGFGARQQLHHQPICAYLSKVVKRPVKMIYDREEEMYASTTRHGALINLKIGVNKDREMTTFYARVYLNTGAYSTLGPVVLSSMNRKMQYRVKNYRFEGHAVYTNSPVAGAMRGYGNPQLNYARETLINEICEEMGWDPVEFRLKNHLRVGDKIPSQDYRVYSCEIGSCAQAANKIKERLEDGRKASPEAAPESRRAWGVAFGCHGSGILQSDQGAAALLVNDDGSVNLLVGAPDIGQGSNEVLTQTVAKILGIDIGQVNIVSNDTGSGPYDTGTFSSRQAYVTGNAVVMAANDVIENVKAGLAKVLDVDPKAISFSDRNFIVNRGKESLTLSFSEAVRRVSFGSTGRVIIGRASYKPESSPPPFAVCLAEVELDPDTNTIKVPNIVMAVDVGYPLNKTIVEGQVHGGVSMGLGFTLSETINIDKRLKRPLESDLLTYKVPLTLDSPDIHVQIVDSYEPTGPLGAKSVGELPTIPVAASIVDAIHKLTGTWVRRLPVTYNLE